MITIYKYFQGNTANEGRELFAVSEDGVTGKVAWSERKSAENEIRKKRVLTEDNYTIEKWQEYFITDKDELTGKRQET